MSSFWHDRPLVRRKFLIGSGAAAIGVTMSGRFALAQDGSGSKISKILGNEVKAETGFALPPLPYDYDALQQAIDAETMKIHHGKHHQAYINNLNAALTGRAELLKMTLADLLTNLDKVPEDIRKTVRNNAGGHANHTLFWNIMGKDQGGEPEGELAKAIAKDFGGFPNFKEQFSQTAIKHFGSGWAWLSVNKDGKLVLESLPNQDSPAMDGKTPIMGLDVWEHAYYLKYKNARAEYVNAWWDVVNWDQVAKNYSAAKA